MTQWQDTQEQYEHLNRWYNRRLPLWQLEYPQYEWPSAEVDDWHMVLLKIRMVVFKDGKPINKIPYNSLAPGKGEDSMAWAFGEYCAAMNIRLPRPQWAQGVETQDEYSDRAYNRMMSRLRKSTQQFLEATQ